MPLKLKKTKASKVQSEADAGDMSHYDPNLGMKKKAKPVMKKAVRAVKKVVKRKMLETAARHMGY